jgi:hypothetical protein
VCVCERERDREREREKVSVCVCKRHVLHFGSTAFEDLHFSSRKKISLEFLYCKTLVEGSYCFKIKVKIINPIY